MLKKSIAFLIIVVLLTSIAGCTSTTTTTTLATSASQGTTQSQAQSSTQASTQATTQATTQASKEPILLGQYTYLTGINANLGIAINNATKLAIKQINEAGGVNGRQLALVTYDDQAKPELTVQMVTRMLEVDKVTAIVASALTASVVAVYPMTEAAKTILVSGGNGTSWTNIGAKYLFRSSSSNAFSLPTLVETIVKFGFSKVGVLAINSEYGTNGIEVITPLFKEAGITATYEKYTYGDTDYTGQLQKLFRDGAETILVYTSNIADCGNIFKQIRRMGYSNYVFSIESANGKEARDIGGNDTNGVVFTAPAVIPDDPNDALTEKEKKFLNDYVKEYGAMPIADVAYRAFDGTQLIFEALKTCTDINDKESIRAAFVKIKDFQGLEGVYDFTDESGDGLRTSGMYIHYGGKVLNLEKYIADHDVTKPFVG